MHSFLSRLLSPQLRGRHPHTFLCVPFYWRIVAASVFFLSAVDWFSIRISASVKTHIVFDSVAKDARVTNEKVSKSGLSLSKRANVSIGFVCDFRLIDRKGCYRNWRWSKLNSLQNRTSSVSWIEPSHSKVLISLDLRGRHSLSLEILSVCPSVCLFVRLCACLSARNFLICFVELLLFAKYSKSQGSTEDDQLIFEVR